MDTSHYNCNYHGEVNIMFSLAKLNVVFILFILVSMFTAKVVFVFVFFLLALFFNLTVNASR